MPGRGSTATRWGRWWRLGTIVVKAMLVVAIVLALGAAAIADWWLLWPIT